MNSLKDLVDFHSRAKSHKNGKLLETEARLSWTEMIGQKKEETDRSVRSKELSERRGHIRKPKKSAPEP